MMSLNTLRTKFGVLLSVVIGGALLAFIFSLKNDVGFSGNDPEVGEVDGKDVNYLEFSKAYEDVRTLYGGDNADYDQSAQFVAQAWQSILADRVLVPGYESLGLTVTEAEHSAMKAGKVPSGIYASLFTDAQTGLYSIDNVNAFVDRAKANPEMLHVWKLINKQARIERVSEKYMTLLRNGVYANALDVQKGLVGANNTYKGRFVLCNYSSIADSLVVVSDSEIKRYYKQNIAKYKQSPYRTVSYVQFEIEPTEADKQAAEEGAALLTNKLSNSSDVLGLAREQVYIAISTNYVAAASLEAEEAQALNGNRTYGPKLEDDEWYASRSIEKINAPKSLELQGFAVPMQEVASVDATYAEARAAADFLAFAEQHNGGDMGEVEFSQLPVEVAKSFVNARVGDVVKVSYGGAIQIFKVVKVAAKSRHYRLATVAYPVEASKATVDAIYKRGSEFATTAKGSLDKFKAAANEASMMTSQMNIQRGSRNIPGLVNSVEVVRWANEAKVGDVSELFKLDGSYVVASLAAVNDEEHKSLESVSAQIKTTLLREKKAAMLRKKMQGATLEEIAAAADAKVESFADAKVSATYVQGLGIEPRVVGSFAAVTAENKGQLLPLVDGGRGVYAVVVDEVVVADEQTAEAERVRLQAEEEMKASRIMWAIQEGANIVDNTVKYF